MIINAEKSWTLYPVSTWLLTKCEDELIPLLTLTVNTYIIVMCGFFQGTWKDISYTIDQGNYTWFKNLKTYRQVSKLQFLSKLIERVKRVQLINRLDKKGLYKVFPSAYRQSPQVSNLYKHDLLHVEIKNLLFGVTQGSVLGPALSRQNYPKAFVNILSMLMILSSIQLSNHLACHPNMTLYFGLKYIF